MSEETQTFPVAKVNRLRSRSRAARRVPDEDCDSRSFVDTITREQGWTVSTIDPAGVVAVFKPLSINPAFRLHAYQIRGGIGGNGIVWALPKDVPLPPPDACPAARGRFLNPPRPLLALDDFMSAIDGDGTPWSYVCASLLKRELIEFGAVWHGLHWDTHDILGRDPTKQDKLGKGGADKWAWAEPAPAEWSPRVRLSDDSVEVVFYTYTGLGQEVIVRHADAFERGRYVFQSRAEVIATGPAGYIF